MHQLLGLSRDVHVQIEWSKEGVDREFARWLEVSVLTKKAGGDEGIRTLGLCVANAPLSHLSYIPTQKEF
jgi:hypothetical protein